MQIVIALIIIIRCMLVLVTLNARVPIVEFVQIRNRFLMRVKLRSDQMVNQVKQNV